MNEPSAAGAGPVLDRALELVRFLRQRCEWDAAQTPATLVPYLLEEAHEVADSIGQGSELQLRGELGDLLLNVAFQLVLAEERGAFTADEAVGTLEAKMRRRHPHLYGGERADWEQLKATERAESAGDSGETSVLVGLARGLDPLSLAHRIQERVATVGFDWPSAHGAFAKVAEELEEVRQALAEEPSPAPATPGAPPPGGCAQAQNHRAGPALEEELGDLLFAVVNLARLSGAHAMRALAAANRKFTDRFEQLERLARERGLVLGQASLEELDALWDEVKER